jgi:zinc protease
MKHIVYIFSICLMAVSTLSAQLDRSKRPEAGPAPEIKLGKAESFKLDNGLKVYVISNSKLPRVTFSLIFDKDPMLEGDKTGLSDMIGEMLTAGTKSRTKDELNEEIDFMGARLNASSSSLSASALSKHKDKIVALMADVLFNPVFPADELDKMKVQSRSGLAYAKNDASSISGTLTTKLVYGSHPYGEVMTETTLDNITVDDVKNYYNTYFKPNVAYLAIVGDITKAEAEKLVKQHFNSWKKGTVPSKKYDVPQAPTKNQVALVDKSSANQSVISVTYPIQMSIDHPDFLAARIANFALGSGASSRLFMNLREDKGYTYGAYSDLGSDRYVASFSAGASVGTDVTAAAIKEILYEMQNLVDYGITEKELAAAKASLSGSFGRSLEQPGTIASFALNIERYKLPKDYYTTYLQRLNAITIEDVNRVAKKYVKPSNAYITVVGNASAVKESLMAFGEVKMYDVEGNPAKEAQAVSGDITPQSVIQNYLKAIGGTSKLEAIKTAEIEMAAEIQGMTMSMNFKHDVPSAQLNQKISMMGNVMNALLIKEGKAKVTQMGQSQEIEGEDYEELVMDMYIFPELHYAELGYEMTLDGIHDVKGDPSYKVIVKNANGGQRINYYSVASGLKVKSENAMTGSTFYRDYKEVDGVKYAMEMEIESPMMPFPLNNKVSKVEFNKAFTADDFK